MNDLAPPRIDAAAPHVVPSVSDKLDARAWTADALCAQSPHDELTWIPQLSAGREFPRGVVDCLVVCAGCPVRAECLEDAMSERRWTVMGVFGGTTMTERTATLATLLTERRMIAAEERPDPLRRVALLEEYEDVQARLDAAAILEATFDARLTMWRQRDAGKVPMVILPPEGAHACLSCGQGFLWPIPYEEAETCSRTCRRWVKRSLAMVERIAV